MTQIEMGTEPLMAVTADMSLWVADTSIIKEWREKLKILSKNVLKIFLK